MSKELHLRVVSPQNTGEDTSPDFSLTAQIEISYLNSIGLLMSGEVNK